MFIISSLELLVVVVVGVFKVSVVRALCAIRIVGSFFGCVSAAGAIFTLAHSGCPFVVGIQLLYLPEFYSIAKHGAQMGSPSLSSKLSVLAENSSQQVKQCQQSQ